MRVWALLAVAFVINLRCVSFCGETNNCTVPCIHFSISPLHLRAEPGSGACQVKEAAAAKTVSPLSDGSNSSRITLSAWDSHSRVFRSDRVYLTRSDTLPDRGLARFVNMGVFTPEVDRVGKVSVSSPILTVIQRRNPLCLLSAFATDRRLLTFKLLEVSW